jgi:serine/threonine protein kinase
LETQNRPESYHKLSDTRYNDYIKNNYRARESHMPTQNRAFEQRYTLHEPLGTGSMGTVYRTTDHLNQTDVALKIVSALGSTVDEEQEHHADNPRLALATELEMLSSLRHPNIVSVLDYGFVEGDAPDDAQAYPYFTMPLLASPQTIVEAGHSQPLETQVNLLIQALQALDYLHQNRTLHRDLKPSNVLVTYNAVGQFQVQVADFGMSRQRDSRAERQGTLPYLAPELLLDGVGTPAADLFALGVIAYELLTGFYPFDTTTAVQLVADIVGKDPNLTPLLELHETLREPGLPTLNLVIGRLLAKDVTERYQDANTVIQDLRRALNQTVPVGEGMRNTGSPSRPPFVGRDIELAVLAGALSQAMDGRGGFWVVNGGDGVGKSRLLAELATLARGWGALSLQGETTPELAIPYGVWREPLRELALLGNTVQTDTALLKLLVNDLDSLVNETVAVPAAPPDGMPKRLYEAINTLLAASPQPLLIVLDDLQWADEASLALLDFLVTALRHVPALIVGSYRTTPRTTDEEEGEGGRFSDNPDVSAVNMRPLERGSITSLAELMLGIQGQNPGLVEMLERDTGGNPLMLVETLRAMRKSQSTNIQSGRATMPIRALVEGIPSIVQRMLARVPSFLHHSLELAALAGHYLDPNLLPEFLPDIPVNGWLNRCASWGLLDVYHGRWRFAHPLIRSGILHGLLDNEEDWNEDHWAANHEQVALALEKVYGKTLDDVYLRQLAYHWNNAHQPEQAAGYRDRVISHDRLLGLT